MLCTANIHASNNNNLCKKVKFRSALSGHLSHQSVEEEGSPQRNIDGYKREDVFLSPSAVITLHYENGKLLIIFSTLNYRCCTGWTIWSDS